MGDPAWYAAIIRDHNTQRGIHTPKSVRVIIVATKREDVYKRLCIMRRALDPDVEIVADNGQPRPYEQTNYEPARFGDG